MSNHFPQSLQRLKHQWSGSDSVQEQDWQVRGKDEKLGSLSFKLLTVRVRLDTAQLELSAWTWLASFPTKLGTNYKDSGYALKVILENKTVHSNQTQFFFVFYAIPLKGTILHEDTPCPGGIIGLSAGWKNNSKSNMESKRYNKQSKYIFFFFTNIFF